LLVQKQA